MALIISPHVLAQFVAMPRADARRMHAKLAGIAADPRASHPVVERTDWYRLRQGDWRAVYTIENGDDASWWSKPR